MLHPRTHAPKTTLARRRGGFSLTDLLVAMALIAVIATIAVPSFFNRSEVTLENAAVLLAHDLRIAQNRAAYLARDVYVGFDVENDGYWVNDADGGPSNGPPYTRRYYPSNAVFEGVAIEEVALGDGAYLVYGPRGMAQTGARVTLRYDGDARILTVDPETGALAILGTTSGFTDDGY